METALYDDGRPASIRLVHGLTRCRARAGRAAAIGFESHPVPATTNAPRFGVKGCGEAGCGPARVVS